MNVEPGRHRSRSPYAGGFFAALEAGYETEAPGVSNARELRPISEAAVAAATKDVNLPAETVSALRGVAGTLAKNLDKQLRTSEKVKSLKATLLAMEGDSSHMSSLPASYRYPPGVAPFRPPPDAEMSEVADFAAGGDYTFSITIPCGTSRLAAQEAVYHKMEVFKRQIALECASAHVKALKALTSLRAIRCSVQEPIDLYSATLRELDIEPPPGLEHRKSLVESQWMTLHAQVVDGVVHRHLKTKKNNEKAQKSRDRIVESVLSQEPVDHLRNAVLQIMSEASAKKGKGIGETSGFNSQVKVRRCSNREASCKRT